MRIEFYGVLREAAGSDHLDVETAPSVTVGEVLAVLCRRVPALEGHLPRVACAVGDEMVLRGDRLGADQTLALLPPVSGG